MKLATFLNTNGISAANFAEAVGVKQPTISRYVKGERFPDKLMILKIEKATHGAVSPSDWYAEAPQ